MGDRLIGRGLRLLLEDNNYEASQVEYTGNHENTIISLVVRLLSKLGVPGLASFIGVLGYSARAIKERVDIIIVGGGQLLLPINKFVYALLGWYLVGRIADCRYCLVSVGTERLADGVSWGHAAILRFCLDRADIVYLRETYSQSVLEEMTGKSYDLVPDTAYWLPIGSYKRRGKEGVVVCPVEFDAVERLYEYFDDPEAYLEEFIGIVRSVRREDECVFVMSTKAGDRDQVKRLYDELRGRLSGPIVMVRVSEEKDVLETIGWARVVVTSRMHAGIIGHSMGADIHVVRVNRKIGVFENEILPREPEELRSELKAKIHGSIVNVGGNEIDSKRLKG